MHLVGHNLADVLGYLSIGQYCDFKVIIAKVLRLDVRSFDEFLVRLLFLLRAVVKRDRKLNCVEHNQSVNY